MFMKVKKTNGNERRNYNIFYFNFAAMFSFN